MSLAQVSRIKVGQTAPSFSNKDVGGRQVALDGIESRYILLAFFRYSGCPWCNLAIHRLSLEYSTLKEHDCEVVAFIQSKKSDIIDNIYGRHAVKPEFPIIADSQLKYYHLYGVNDSIKAGVKSITKIPAWIHSVKKHGFKQQKVDGNLFLVPASFLIDGRTRKIIKASYGSSFYETKTFIDIYQSVFFKEL